jgi:hypothetical protein
MSYWFSGMYADIDAMRLDAFAAALAPDVERSWSATTPP